jgi:hypothetical protein
VTDDRKWRRWGELLSRETFTRIIDRTNSSFLGLPVKHVHSVRERPTRRAWLQCQLSSSLSYSDHFENREEG